VLPLPIPPPVVRTTPPQPVTPALVRPPPSRTPPPVVVPTPAPPAPRPQSGGFTPPPTASTTPLTDAQIATLTARLNCGDLNGDGEVNGADLGKMLIGWGQCQ
jgi:hypothetical protein